MSRRWRWHRLDATVRPRARRARFPAPPLLLALMLTGCQALLAEGTSTVAGIGGASIADSVGANAATTTGIGLGV